MAPKATVDAQNAAKRRRVSKGPESQTDEAASTTGHQAPKDSGAAEFLQSLQTGVTPSLDQLELGKEGVGGSKYQGVSLNNKTQKFRVSCKGKYLGEYKTDVEGAIVRWRYVQSLPTEPQSQPSQAKTKPTVPEPTYAGKDAATVAPAKPEVLKSFDGFALGASALAAPAAASTAAPAKAAAPKAAASARKAPAPKAGSAQSPADDPLTPETPPKLQDVAASPPSVEKPHVPARISNDPKMVDFMKSLTRLDALGFADESVAAN